MLICEMKTLWKQKQGFQKSEKGRHTMTVGVVFFPGGWLRFFIFSSFNVVPEKVLFVLRVQACFRVAP